jgi:hypothetical protein
VAIFRRIVLRLAETSYVKGALANPVELSALRRKPTRRVWVGIFLAGLAYLIGWPLILLLGYLAVRLGEPLVVVIGGPVAYGISHLTFLAGAYLAGADYVKIFMSWATRRLFERLLGAQRPAVAPPDESGAAGEAKGRPDGG